MAIDERKIINGTHGTVFLDGEEVAEVKSFQAKLEFQKEEVKIAGKMATGTKYMGYSGKGSLALHKTVNFSPNILVNLFISTSLLGLCICSKSAFKSKSITLLIVHILLCI